jgi:hypothetical protein
MLQLKYLCGNSALVVATPACIQPCKLKLEMPPQQIPSGEEGWRYMTTPTRRCHTDCEAPTPWKPGLKSNSDGTEHSVVGQFPIPAFIRTWLSDPMRIRW